MPSGKWGYRIPNYSSGKRRFKCFISESEAIEAAIQLSRNLNKRQMKLINSHKNNVCLTLTHR